MQDTWNCLLIEVEVTLVLHVLVRKVDHLGQHEITGVILELQWFEFRLEVVS